MKKKYYIIGSGGFAKEVLFLAEENLDITFEFGGFIDFNPKNNLLKVRGKFVPVIEENYFLENIKPSTELDLYFGIGDPILLKRLANVFQGYNFPNLIHNAFIGDRGSIKLGNGNIITAGCIFTVDINIGSFNVFNLNTTIGHDVNIEDCNIFNPGCNVSGNVNIGCNNLFGTNSTILQGILIGSDNVLGASSLANKNILCNSIMVGVPAKKLDR
jgi:sugar O-acyltransferase (sialic acid O-acetyltransferase NeuD family)